ncbi:MAG: heparan-alpha-glucosaminide N-acetyltransferase [Acidobacteriota bacterium]|nr:heparan-alpha-glucosaminide N-acetyltransferase [Acidobacteriota bacterium]
MPETNRKPARSRKAADRIWEIDFLRGLAIILMVAYHFGYDLTELAGIKSVLGIAFDLQSGPFRIAVDVFAGLFVVLCGVSCSLTRSNFRRGLKLLGVALLVTAASYVFSPEETIHFGILHCLAVCILLYGATLEKAGPLKCLAAAGIVFGLSFAVPLALRNTPIRFDWLLPFGLTSYAYASFDYFPLLPWFGVFLVGSAAGKKLYASRRSLLPKGRPVPLFNAAGRYSLWIYVIHQPVLLGIFYALGLMR